MGMTYQHQRFGMWCRRVDDLGHYVASVWEGDEQCKEEHSASYLIGVKADNTTIWPHQFMLRVRTN